MPLDSALNPLHKISEHNSQFFVNHCGAFSYENLCTTEAQEALQRASMTEGVAVLSFSLTAATMNDPALLPSDGT